MQYKPIHRTLETEQKWMKLYELDFGKARLMNVAQAKQWFDDEHLQTYKDIGRKVCSVDKSHNYVIYDSHKSCRTKLCHGTLSLKLNNPKDADKYKAYLALYIYIKEKTAWAKTSDEFKQNKKDKQIQDYHSNEENPKKQQERNRRYAKRNGTLSKKTCPRIRILEIMIIQFIINMLSKFINFENIDASIIIFFKNEYLIQFGSNYEYDMSWDLVIKWSRYANEINNENENEIEIEKKMISNNEFDHILQVQRDAFRCLIVGIQFFAALIFAPNLVDFHSLHILRLNPHNVASDSTHDHKENDEDEKQENIYDKKEIGEFEPLYAKYNSYFKYWTYDREKLYMHPKRLINMVQRPCETLMQTFASEFYPFDGLKTFGKCIENKKESTIDINIENRKHKFCITNLHSYKCANADFEGTICEIINEMDCLGLKRVVGDKFVKYYIDCDMNGLKQYLQYDDEESCIFSLKLNKDLNKKILSKGQYSKLEDGSVLKYNLFYNLYYNDKNNEINQLKEWTKDELQEWTKDNKGYYDDKVDRWEIKYKEWLMKQQSNGDDNDCSDQ
eukprot:151482_1